VPQLTDPDYKNRPVFREADLRRHLINEIKSPDNAVLEEDTKEDPRFSATPDTLKKQGIEDFQLWYALRTIARLGGAQQVAAVTHAMTVPPKPAAAAK
jgi:carboxyl-terminal processing protease